MDKKMTSAQAIAQTLKKKRAKLPKSLKKTDEVPNIVNEINIIDYSADLKSKMTVKELKFLEIYFQGNISKTAAMKAAGFNDLSQNHLYVVAARIIEKHESQGEDNRILARAMGMGEVRVLKVLWELMQSKIERIRLDAVVYLGKILGMTREQVEGAQGITIIFEGTANQAQPAAVALSTEQPIQQAPVRVLQITK